MPHVNTRKQYGYVALAQNLAYIEVKNKTSDTSAILITKIYRNKFVSYSISNT